MIIFSTEQATLSTADNLTNELALLDVAQDQKIKLNVVEGQIKGVDTLAFIANDVEFGREAAIYHNQKTYLERGHKGVWYEIDTASGKVLGSFERISEVSRDRAVASESYAKVDGKYYLGTNYRKYV